MAEGKTSHVVISNEKSPTFMEQQIMPFKKNKLHYKELHVTQAARSTSVNCNLPFHSRLAIKILSLHLTGRVS